MKIISFDSHFNMSKKIFSIFTIIHFYLLFEICQYLFQNTHFVIQMMMVITEILN